jgi:hypothetical protein
MAEMPNLMVCCSAGGMVAAASLGAAPLPAALGAALVAAEELAEGLLPPEHAPRARLSTSPRGSRSFRPFIPSP